MKYLISFFWKLDESDFDQNLSEYRFFNSKYIRELKQEPTKYNNNKEDVLGKVLQMDK